MFWSTASETNNYGFEIQASNNSQDFETIAFVQGHGTTTNPQTYQYSFIPRQMDRMYLRLKQIDFDGAIILSKVVSLEFNQPDKFKLSPCYPNPFSIKSAGATISFQLTKDTLVEINIYDITGKLVRQLYRGKALKGQHSLKWDGRDAHDTILANGMYLVQFIADGMEKVQKVASIK